MQKYRLSGFTCRVGVLAAVAAALCAALAAPVRADDTGYVQGLINAANAHGGGASLEARSYDVTSLDMKSNVTLVLPAGCVLNLTHGPLSSTNVSNIAIKGHGTINELYNDCFPVDYTNVTNFLISGITVHGFRYDGQGSWPAGRAGGYFTDPCWHCSHGVFRGVTIDSDKHIQWTDGLDLSNCNDIQVVDCTFSTGDDGVSVKAFSHTVSMAGQTFTGGSSHITVKGCTFANSHGMPMGIGDETFQPISDITFAHNKVTQISGSPYKLWVARSGQSDWLARDNHLASDPPAPISGIHFSDNTGCGADEPSGISFQGNGDWPTGVTFNGAPLTSLKTTARKIIALAPGN